MARAFLVHCLLALAVLAQTGTRTLTGAIHSVAGGVPKSSIEVILYTEYGHIVHQDFANPDGRFTVSHIPYPANYRLVIKAEGYQESEQLVRVDLATPREFHITVFLRPLKETKSSTEAARSVTEYRVPKPARRRFEKARKALRENNLAKAVQELEKAVEIYPSYLEALKTLALAQLQQRRYDEAHQALQRALAVDEKYPDAYVALGALYNAQGQPQDAVPVLKRGTELDPTSWQAHYELSMAYFDLEEFEQALTHCERAVQYHPKELPEAFVHRGNIYWRQGRYEEALTEFTTFVKQYPRNRYFPYAQRALEALKERTGRN